MTDEIPVPTEENPYRNVSYMSKVTGFKTATVRSWIRDGKLPGFRVHGEWRVMHADFVKFLKGKYSDNR